MFWKNKCTSAAQAALSHEQSGSRVVVQLNSGALVLDRDAVPEQVWVLAQESGL